MLKDAEMAGTSSKEVEPLPLWRLLAKVGGWERQDKATYMMTRLTK